MPDTGEVIRFPTQLRIVPVTEPSAIVCPAIETAVPVVDHDGRLYPLHTLLTQIPDAHRLELQDEVPRSGQEAWDTVTRRWPALAACIVAGVHVDSRELED